MESSTPEGVTVTVKQEPEEPDDQQGVEGGWSVAPSQRVASPLDQVVIKTERTSVESGNGIGPRDSQGSCAAVHYKPTLNRMTNPLGRTPYKPLLEKPPGGSRTIFQDSRVAVRDLELPEDLSTKGGVERTPFQSPQIIDTEGRRIHIPLQGRSQTMFHESGFAIRYHEDLSSKEGIRTSALERRYFQGRQIFNTDHRTIDGMGTSALEKQYFQGRQMFNTDHRTIDGMGTSTMERTPVQKPPYADTRSLFTDKVQANHRAGSDDNIHGGGVTMIHESGVAIRCQEDILNQESMKTTKDFEGTSCQRPHIPCADTRSPFKGKVQAVHQLGTEDTSHGGRVTMVHESGVAIRCQEDILTQEGKESSIFEERSCHRPEIPLATTKTSLDEEVQPVQKSDADDQLSQCKVCLKSFLHLKSHMKVHTSERPFKCSVCDKAYIESRHLENHMRSHTGEKPFQCPVCQKAFSRDTHLTYHLRTHTGIKPFTCETCGKSFSRKGDLTVHNRIHTGERPFACKLCDKACSTQSNLKLHMRGHTGEKPYSCTACPKTFKSKSDLIKHVRTHTGERPYQCVECHREFRASSDLTRHMRSHTNEKPYKCNVCLKEFSSDGYLPKHVCVPKTTNSIFPRPIIGNGEAMPLQTSLGCDNEKSMEAERLKDSVIQNTVNAPLESVATFERDVSKID